MSGLRHWRRRWYALVALAGVLALMVVGGGIAIAVNSGTAGELQYVYEDHFVNNGAAPTSWLELTVRSEDT